MNETDADGERLRRPVRRYIIQCGCLEDACSDISTFERAMKVLSSLLKPGGVLVDVST